MNVIAARTSMSTAFLVVDDDRAMIIDTGVPGQAPAILRAVADAGLQPTDVGLIVLTHHHFDHSGSAGELATATGAPVAIHRLDAPTLRAGGAVELHPTRLSSRLMKPMLARNQIPAYQPDIELGDAEDLSGYGGFGRTTWTPGHTEGSICVVLPDGTLFAGDAVTGGLARPRTAQPPMFVVDKAAAARSAAEIAGRHAPRVYVSHGGPLHPQTLRRLDTTGTRGER